MVIIRKGTEHKDARRMRKDAGTREKEMGTGEKEGGNLLVKGRT